MSGDHIRILRKLPINVMVMLMKHRMQKKFNLQLIYFMTDKEQFIAMIDRDGLVFSDDEVGKIDKVYVRGKWGGADFHFNKEGALIGGEVIGDECDFYKR